MTIVQLILVCLFIVLIYNRFRRKALTAPIQGLQPPVAFCVFTPTDLLNLNGDGGKPIYLAVRGRVFDVMLGKIFYGPIYILTISLRFKGPPALAKTFILGWTVPELRRTRCISRIGIAKL
jgi:hypothetical protein